jgi:hypothetical protein
MCVSAARHDRKAVRISRDASPERRRIRMSAPAAGEHVFEHAAQRTVAGQERYPRFTQYAAKDTAEIMSQLRL